MSKAVKLVNNQYLSTQYVVHKRGGGWYYLNNLLDNIYPIGSIFLTTSDTNPSTYFGGTWQKMSGGFLYACVSTIDNDITNTPGSASYNTTLTINQMPRHNHETTFKFSYGQGSDYAITWTNGQWQGPYGNALGAFAMNETGGSEGHNHNIPHIGVWVWKRIS